ncbi:MAG TPA: ABC transporter permease [Gemmatimonadales bacterium]|nr:ABC transporter permease [Gemmatimonadales bacterium]
MRKVLAVIRREFVSRVRTRAFLISTIGGPLIMGFFFMLPAILAGRDTRVRHLVVLDAASGELGQRIAERLSREVRDTSAAVPQPRYRVEYVSAGGRTDQLRDSLVALTGLKNRSDALDGIVLVTDSTLESGTVEYLGTDVGSPTDMARLSRTLTPVVQVTRLTLHQVDPALAFSATRAVDLKTQRISEGKLTGQSGEASFLLAYIMGFLLYIALLLYGVQVMNSVLEEKTNRIMEVLVSSLSPFELMLGKILGVGAVGLVQLGIWAGTAMVLTTYRVQAAALLGVPAASVASLPIPAVTPAMLAVFLTFFILGFLLYSAAYAAVGSMCNSHQEVQQAQMPITLFIGLGFITMFSLLGDPNGSLAQLLSYLPPFAPFVIPVRYSMNPLALTEILLAALSVIAGIVIVTWIAARIYRVGILSYGKKPSFRELARWVRAA